MLNKKNVKRQTYLLLGGISIALIIGLVILYRLYDRIYGSNIIIQEQLTAYIHIPTKSTMDDVTRILDTSGFLQDKNQFRWLAEKKNYPNHIHPGRYLIEDGMSNNALINMLRSGRQDPVNLVFNNIRTKRQLAGVISKQIEADSNVIFRLLQNEQYLQRFHFTPQTVQAMFIPNTYEVWWDTSAREFMERMNREYQRFWNGRRKRKAEQLGFNPVEISILASIVDEETLRDEEMPKIAGVYINRLKRGMRLQADPTIKFAIGDFSIKRVLDKHLKVESPYNTYKHGGLPPGPISFPSIAAIEAVLHYQNHDYLYFCAKPDFSGYHNFSVSHRQHILNARQYQQALNRRKITE